MDTFLNIFAYQTFGLQQFAGAFPNWAESIREITHSKNIHASVGSDRVSGDSKNDVVHASVGNDQIFGNIQQENIHASVGMEKLYANIVDE